MQNNHRAHHYLNGQWILGDGVTFTSVNPATNHTIWEGTQATEAEIKWAYEAANHASAAWENIGFHERVHYIQNFAKQVELIRANLAEIISIETGKPLWESVTEVASVIGKINLSIQAYQDRTAEKEIANPDGVGHLRYKPHGVIAVLGPFNFPAHLSNGHIVPALLAGNTIVYKPSELTPAVAELIMQCWHKSNIPPGVINCIQGDSTCAKALLEYPIQGVYFTGSYQTGLKINQQLSSRPEVILALEMGGNNPLIIDKVTNIDAALYHTLLSTLITSGQRCSCARRILIADNQQGQEFLERFIKLCQTVLVGPYTKTPEPFMGPVIRHSHALAHIEAQQRLQKAGGESLLTMRLLTENSAFLSPGIIDMTPVAKPVDEEIFAPFIQIYRYHDFDHALMLANQTHYGLAAGLLSDSKTHYELFYRTIRAGLINWNRPTTGAASNLPFGGVGRSGNHRPSAYFAADYCAYPIASIEQSNLTLPPKLLPGIHLK